MFFWMQGLRPIVSQVVLDTLCSAVMFYIANRTTTRSFWEEFAYLILISAVAIRLWDRWTIAFPSIPFIFLQVLRLIAYSADEQQHRNLLLILLRVGGNLFATMAAILCILVPPLQLKEPTGPYFVGAIDVFLPRSAVDKQTVNKPATSNNSDFVAARIFYPATSSMATVLATPYLYHTSQFSNLYLNSLARLLMPVFVYNQCGWIFGTWKLITVPAGWEVQLMHPQPASDEQPLWPVIIHSHGLMASPHLYTHQGLALASYGNVVVMVHHRDGSSPLVCQRDGSTLEYSIPKPIPVDYDTDSTETKNSANDRSTQQQAYVDGATPYYTVPEPSLDNGTTGKEQQFVALVRARRRQTHYRAMDMISAFESIKLLHEKDSSITEGVSFQGKLDVSNVVFSGHSFGGASALTAAAYRPDIALAVVAHDPGTDWMPDFGRKALFMNEARMEGSNILYTGGTAKLNKGDKSIDVTTISSTPDALHDKVPMLVLYSDQWAKKGWAGFPILKCMHDRGQFGPSDDGKSVSRVNVICQMNHGGFTDCCALLPLWLGRGGGFTGERNPLDVQDEIIDQSIYFLYEVRTANEFKKRK